MNRKERSLLAVTPDLHFAAYGARLLRHTAEGAFPCRGPGAFGPKMLCGASAANAAHPCR